MNPTELSDRQCCHCDRPLPDDSDGSILLHPTNDGGDVRWHTRCYHTDIPSEPPDNE